MDLFSKQGSELKQFMISNDLKNFVTKFTRIATNYYSEKDVYRTSKTLIDVILHNEEEIISTKVFGCPFSDHNFVLATLSINLTSVGQPDPIHCRKLTESNLDKIAKEISLINYDFIDSESNTNDKWLLLKSKLIEVNR